jgi:Photosynthesis system II assembly factor YCF48/Putative zinc-finger
MNEKIPKPMLNALAREAAPADHPSADVLAAFVEHGLAEREKQSVSDHLARCEECREIVFLTIDTTEAGELAVVAKPPGRSKSKWAWAIPVAAMLLLGSAYLVRESGVAPPAAREIASKSVPEKASGPPGQLPEATPAPPPSAASAPSPAAKARPRTTPATTALAQKAQPAGADILAMNAAPPAPANGEGLKVTASPAEPAGIAVGGPVAGTVPKAPMANGFAPTTGEGVQQQYRGTDSLGLSVNRGLAAVARISHPGWRVTQQGQLEHFTPDGWSRALADQTSAFRAVSVIGNDVWAGGNDGMLFHSGDEGLHWNRLSIPSASGAETVTIVSIRFDDAQHGVVVADTGASYGTTDGGATWTKQ